MLKYVSFASNWRMIWLRPGSARCVLTDSVAPLTGAGRYRSVVLIMGLLQVGLVETTERVSYPDDRLNCFQEQKL